MLDGNGGTAEVVHRFMNRRGDLVVFGFDLPRLGNVFFLCFPVRQLTFLNAGFCFVEKTVNLIRHHPRFSLDKIPGIFQIVCQLIGVRHGIANFAAGFSHK